MKNYYFGSKFTDRKERGKSTRNLYIYYYLEKVLFWSICSNYYFFICQYIFAIHNDSFHSWYLMHFMIHLKLLCPFLFFLFPLSRALSPLPIFRSVFVSFHLSFILLLFILLIFHIRETVRYLSFCVWFISLNVGSQVASIFL